MAAESGQPIGGVDPAHRLVGGFEVLDEIGRGGMAVVFKARQVSVDRTVALKILPPHLASNKDYVRRFLREARSVAHLSHPNIVQAIDAGRAGAYYYYAMEFVDGESASALLQRNSVVPERRALQIARDIARALQHAHEAGIVHRDVKPGNILIAKNGTAKLADLGLARVTTKSQTTLTQTGMMLGTPDYISPEQVRGEAKLDGRADIYALGATLFHLVTGRPAHPGDTGVDVMYKHLHDPVPDAAEVNPAVSAGTAAIIRKMMAKDRGERYQTAGELLADLERRLATKLLRGAGPAPVRPITPAPAVVPPTPITAPALQRKRRPKTGLYAAGAAAALVLGVLLLVAFLPKSGRPKPPPAVANRTVQPPTTTRTKDEDLLESIAKWVKDHPADCREGIRRYERAMSQVKSPAIRLQMEDAKGELRTAYQRVLDEAFAKLADAALKLAESGDYDAAIAEYANLSKELRDELDSRVRAGAETLKAAAESKIKAAMAAAEKLSDEGEPAKALEELNRVKSIRYAALAGEVVLLRRRLEGEEKDAAEVRRRQEIAAARKNIEKLCDDIDAAARKMDFNEISRLADAARKNESLKLAQPQLQPVLAVAAAFDAMRAAEQAHPAIALRQNVGRTVTLRTKLGPQTGIVKEVTDDTVILEKTFRVGGEERRRTVQVPIGDLTPEGLADFKTKWTPKTPDDYIAAAILAAGSGDIPALEAALKAAGNHPLSTRCSAKLIELKLAAREAEAERDWATSLGPYERKPKLSENEELARIKALDTYLAQHAGTKFANDRWGPVATIRAAPRERAAQNAWTKITPFLSNPSLSSAQAQALANAIDQFQDKHRGTGCAERAQRDIAALEDKILPHMPGRRFDSKLALGVGLYNPSNLLTPHILMGGAGAWGLGTTPSKDGKGITIPSGAVWFVVPPNLKELTDEQLKEVAAEVQKKGIAGLNLCAAPLLTDAGFATLAPCTQLRFLGLSRTKFSDAAMAKLAGLTNLEYLDLFETHGFTDVGMRHLKNMTNLKRLVVHSCGRITDAGLENLKGLTRLEALCIAYHRGITNAGMPCLQNLTDLKCLDLSWTSVRDDGLAHLRPLGKLELLHLDGNYIGDKGLEHLAGLTSLSVLTLSSARITDDGLANIKGMTEMETLSLTSAKVTGPGLANIAKFTHLKSLNLAGSAVTDDGLAQLAPLTQLEVLNLGGCAALTDAGLAHLKNLSQLRSLNLGGVPGITDAGLAHLKPLRWLRSLNVSGTTVTDRGVDELKTATLALSIDR